MATLYKTDGSSAEVNPENETNFMLHELYKLLSVQMIEIIHLKDDKIMVCDEEGKLTHEPMLNLRATFAFQDTFGPCDQIYGNALICREDEVR